MSADLPKRHKFSPFIYHLAHSKSICKNWNNNVGAWSPIDSPLLRPFLSSFSENPQKRPYVDRLKPEMYPILNYPSRKNAFFFSTSVVISFCGSSLAMFLRELIFLRKATLNFIPTCLSVPRARSTIHTCRLNGRRNAARFSQFCTGSIRHGASRWRGWWVVLVPSLWPRDFHSMCDVLVTKPVPFPNAWLQKMWLEMLNGWFTESSPEKKKLSGAGGSLTPEQISYFEEWRDK